MTKREEQIRSLRAKGLCPSEIHRRIKGVISKQAVLAILNEALPSTAPAKPKRVQKLEAPVVLKCNGKENCPCVLCEARHYKFKHKGINEFGTGGGRSEANCDRRVVRHAIGRI